MSNGVAKIQKLLRRARDISNAHEAELAGIRARELMDALKIEVILDYESDMVIAVGKRADIHRQQLASIVAASRGCGARANMAGQLVIVGKRCAAEDAAVLYGQLARMAIRNEKLVGDVWPGSARKVYRHLFWFSFVDAVTSRLKPVAREFSPMRMAPSNIGMKIEEFQSMFAKARQDLIADVAVQHADADPYAVAQRLDALAKRKGREAGVGALLPAYIPPSSVRPAGIRIRGFLPFYVPLDRDSAIFRKIFDEINGVATSP